MAKGIKSEKQYRSDKEISKEKQESFKRVCTPRVNKAIKAISLVGLCASANYESSQAETKAVVLALETAVADVKARFSGEQKATAGFTLPA